MAGEPRLRLLTGDPDREFTGVHITDLPEPGRYLSGGELVLTGLMWRRGPEDSAAYVAALAEAGVAVLGAGQAWLGHVPADLVAACERAGLPLLEVPTEVSFRTLAERAAPRLTGDAREALGRHRRLVAAVAEGAGLPELFALTAADLGITGAVVSAAGEVILGTVADPAELARAYLTASRLPCLAGAHTLFRVGRGHRAAGWVLACDGDLLDRPDLGYELAACVALERSRIEEGRRVERRLAAHLLSAALSGTDTTDLNARLRTCGLDARDPYAVVSATLQEGPPTPIPAFTDPASFDPAVSHPTLLTGPRTYPTSPEEVRGNTPATSGGIRRPDPERGGGPDPGARTLPEGTPGGSAARGPAGGVHSGARGRARDGESAVRGRAGDGDPAARGAVRGVRSAVHGPVGEGGTGARPGSELRQAGVVAGRVLEELLGREIVASPGADGAVAVVPLRGLDVDGLAERLRAGVEVLAALPGARVCLGVSGELSGAAALRGGMEEAGHARRLAEARAGGVVTSDEIYTHALLLATVPGDVRGSFARRLLDPLFDYDARHRSELVRTLSTFLDCSGSWNACAERMHVHVNTVRYRIKRVEELTGRDLSAMADRVDLFLALRAR